MRFVVAKGFHIYSWQNATENRGYREICYRSVGKLKCPVRRMKIHKGRHGRFVSTTIEELAG